MRYGYLRSGAVLISGCLSALFASMLFVSCEGGTTSGTESGSKINLTGKVIGKDNAPISGVVARLSKTGLADTTDSGGKFLLEGDVPSGSGNSGFLDTLVILQDSQRIAGVGITKWVDSLPDIKVVQRGFSGDLEEASVEIGRVEAVLFGTGIPEGRPIVAEFFYNKPSGEYSGYVFFPASGKGAAYIIYISIFDEDGYPVGRSDTISFNGLAGDITIPVFAPDNVKLRALAGNDTVVAPGSKVILRGISVTPPETQVVEYAWKIHPDKEFTASPDGSVEWAAPAANDSTTVAELRVKNSLGQAALDTVLLGTGPLFDFDILLEVPGDTTVPPKSSLVLEAKAVSESGRNPVVEIAWKIGEEADFKAYPDGRVEVAIPDQNDSLFPAVARAKNSLGSIRLDTVWISTTSFFDELAKQPFRLAATIPDFPPMNLTKAVVYRDKIWVADARGLSREIWKSGDGEIWTKVTEDPSFGDNREFSLVAFKDKMWLIGGTSNEVWNSADGKDWVRVADSTAYKPRGFHQSVVFQDRIWVFGAVGAHITPANGIWRSSDGLDWELVTDKPVYDELRAVQVNQGKIWIWNHWGDIGHSSTIYSSPDGLDWKMNFFSRAGLDFETMVVFEDNLLFIADLHAFRFERDCCFDYADVKNPFPPSLGSALVPFKNRIFRVGGNTGEYTKVLYWGIDP